MGVPVAVHAIKDPASIKANPERLMEFDFEKQALGSHQQVWEALAAVGHLESQDPETGVIPDRNSGILEFKDGSAWEIDLENAPGVPHKVMGILIEMRNTADVPDKVLQDRFAALCKPLGWTAYYQEHDPSAALLYVPD